ncbi:hypothetical protein GYMLUDRAFT_119642, partial [Collybiopsis luxurians FD-317 M1]
LAAFIEINGVKAFALFDSGSTADAISPDFARVAQLKMFQLENPITLQLGTKGSRSQITYGCIAPYLISKQIKDEDYFDIANVDRYDVVLGTVFMRKHGISLDFENNKVRVSGELIPTLSEGEEVRELTRQNQTPYTEEDIPRLRKKWINSCKDIMNGVPEKMPPFREVNHSIPLIDENKKYRYYLPRCPDSLCSQLDEKIAKYVRAGWWKPMSVQQAAPMLCIPK